MKILLTGGTGFIGSYVTKALSDNGHEVTILARNPDKVPGLRNLPGVNIVKGLLNDFEIIKTNLAGMDACIHIALGWGDTGIDMLKNDTIPSVYIMEQAAKCDVKHFIYTSSTAALGNLEKMKTNEYSKTKPIDFYGATKASCENYLFAISNYYPIRCNIIRPGYTFGNPVIKGAFMQPDKRFKEIVNAAKQNNDIKLIKYDGTQFIYAGDLAKIYTNILNSSVNKKIFFGLSSEYTTWEKIAKKVIELTGSKSKIILEDKGLNKEPQLYDIKNIKEEFNLKFYSDKEITKHLNYLITLF